MITLYDNLIKQKTQQYLPGTDWRLIKAQLQAESALNPQATSTAGAMGIAQFMPDTWEEMKQQLNLPNNATPYDYHPAITACCHYMQQLNTKWTAPRPEADRYCLALASYNAGMGNILKAQKAAGNANDYATIIKHLHKITGHHAKETNDYTRRIFKIWGEYIHGDR